MQNNATFWHMAMATSMDFEQRMENSLYQLPLAVLVGVIAFWLIAFLGRRPGRGSASDRQQRHGRGARHSLARVRHIIDGDTLVVSINMIKMTVRLYGIDCPEDGQEWGDTAKQGLQKLVGGRDVRLEEHGIDDHERTLATVYVQAENSPEWINVNLRMVTLGHAWVTRNFLTHLPHDRRDKIIELENWARSKNIGLWGTPQPVPPWHWRSHGRPR
jgi:endonuclease YncB( thermonuclease family)